MDRMELKKRWLMGTVHPELFYLPWGHRKDLCRVYIYCNVYSIDETYPDLETAKQNGVRPNRNYGFIIFDKNYNIVAKDSFCVPLPVGIYYAVQYRECGYIPSLISYEPRVLMFEVKKDMKELIIDIDGTTRVYYVQAKFKPETCIETKVRNWVTQNVSYNSGYGMVSETRVVDLVEANFTENKRELNDYTETKCEMIPSSEIPYGQLGDVTSQKPSYNIYNKSSFTLYPNVIKHHTEETNKSNKLKVYFDIYEKNDNYDCLDYTFNISSDVKYNHYSVKDYENNTENESIDTFKSHIKNYSDKDENSVTVNRAYNSQFVPADITWTVRNGWFVDEETTINIMKQSSINSYNGFVAYQDQNWSLLPINTTLASNTNIGKYHTVIDDLDTSIWGYVGLSPAIRYDVPAGVQEFLAYRYGVPRYYVCKHFDFYNNPTEDMLPENIDETYNGDELTDLYGYISDGKSISTNLWINFHNKYDKNTTLSDDKINTIIENDVRYDNYKSQNSLSYTQYRQDVEYYYKYGLCNGTDYNNTYILWGNFFVSGDALYDYGYVTNNITIACNHWIICKQRNIIFDTGTYNYVEIDPTYVVVHYSPISHYNYIDENHKYQLQFKVFEQAEVEKYFDKIYDGKSLKTLYNNGKSTLYLLDGGYHDFELDIDKQGNRLILFVDESVNITEDEYLNYKKGVYSENIEQIVKKENEFKDKLNLLQQEYILKYKEEYGEVPITELPKKDGD